MGRLRLRSCIRAPGADHQRRGDAGARCLQRRQDAVPRIRHRPRHDADRRRGDHRDGTRAFTVQEGNVRGLRRGRRTQARWQAKMARKRRRRRSSPDGRASTRRHCAGWRQCTAYNAPASPLSPRRQCGRIYRRIPVVGQARTGARQGARAHCTPMNVRDADYCPIADYALIGDCRGSALVARDGGIDWATLHRFDADPVFCRLLDAKRGGFWSIRPGGEYSATRAYLAGTNILRTVFSSSTGTVALTDFMPVGRKLGAGVHDYVHLNAPGWIVRRIEGLDGEMELDVTYRPSRKFAREPAELRLDEGAVRAGVEMPTLYGDVIFSITGDCATGRLQITAGQTSNLVLADNVVEGEPPPARVKEFLKATRAFWEEWIAYCRYRGPYQETVRRSALLLKLLTYAPTGAMVAAPTTSLPEEIGGERNWDYRYCWVRDSCFTLYALAVLGYGGEADCFDDYLLRSCAR